jgi:exonuclease SbcC
MGDAVAALARARTDVAEAVAVAAEARLVLGEGLAVAGFVDAEAARAAARTAEEIDQGTARIAEWAAERERVRVGIEHPSLAGLADLRPDPAPAQREAEQASQSHRALLEARVRVRAAARLVGDIAAEHRRVDDELTVARAEHEVRHRLAEVCAGRGGDRVSLQRWVLASHFATVCDRANARLAVMTAGRYSLRVHTGSTRGAATGLDLRVHDAHTGEAREVTSLSGGETFQASLALALGVADVVGERSGGTDLGVLFVDEGFGTLDPDALQLALDELDELRSGGRMVGVISHVAGLRERIRAGIEVRRGPAGSQVLVSG